MDDDDTIHCVIIALQLSLRVCVCVCMSELNADHCISAGHAFHYIHYRRNYIVFEHCSKVPHAIFYI